MIPKGGRRTKLMIRTARLCRLMGISDPGTEILAKLLVASIIRLIRIRRS